MQVEKPNSTAIAEALEALRQEVARLGERVAALEARTESATRGASVAPPEAKEELSEEILLVLSAAIAAYLGKKAPIRQIRLLGSPAWAEHGRVTIQASHALSTHHGRSPA